MSKLLIFIHLICTRRLYLRFSLVCFHYIATRDRVTFFAQVILSGGNANEVKKARQLLGKLNIISYKLLRMSHNWVFIWLFNAYYFVLLLNCRQLWRIISFFDYLNAQITLVFIHIDDTKSTFRKHSMHPWSFSTFYFY